MHLQRVKYRDIEEVPQLALRKNFKAEFAGSAPAPFIGRFNYPNVNVGILSPQYSGEMQKFDSPKFWSKFNLPIGSVASLRYGLVNSRQNSNVHELSSKFMEICQEVGMASKAAEVEVKLKDQPKLQLKAEKEIMPFGPQGEAQKVRITTNTKVDNAVEKVVRDTDLKAVGGLMQLYQKGFEESFLNKILSVGNLGLKENRKLVPTRWSITAVDDTIGKKLIDEVKEFSCGEYQAYFGGSWGNYYLLLFFPKVWSYELFETHLEREVNPWSKKGLMYSTDYEDYGGRKAYAEECAGAYYSTRLATLEKMKSNKRQNTALVLRFITSEYNIPLGVWVTREASRKALANNSIIFASEELMLKYAKELIKMKFAFDLDPLLSKSQILRNIKHQQKLTKFF